MLSSSNFDNIVVQVARENLGRMLAKQDLLNQKYVEMLKNKRTIIAPVPKTSIPIAEGYMNEIAERGLHVRQQNFLIPLSADRTFINDYACASKAESISEKFAMRKEIVGDLYVILIDDSIVRGNTSKELISYIRGFGGAAEIHMRSASPPIISFCHTGINMKTLQELIAARILMKLNLDNRENKEYNLTSELLFNEIGKEIGADSLVYQTIDGLIKAVSDAYIGNKKIHSEKSFCTSCFTGKYMEKSAQEEYYKQHSKLEETLLNAAQNNK
ncbi:MAG TPA: hypothetical protein VI894_01800 [Candidatus Nanoarchaeia archaeon]|nr:hypothetical protein [Candidatus Nanoarchaeia archaeon]